MLAKALGADLTENVVLGRAHLRTIHRRPIELDTKTGLYLFEEVDEPTSSWNLILNVGRIQLHKQGYGTSGLAANGQNYIALTNTNVTPAAGDTTLSGEIVANGLSRAQGAVTLPVGSGNQTTIDKTFTCATGAQAAQAAALFDASSSGNMNHELNFTQRSLQVGDTLQTTYTITLG